MNKNFITGLHKVLKGCLLLITLVTSTMAVFLNQDIASWSEMPFIVWCFSLIILVELIDGRK